MGGQSFVMHGKEPSFAGCGAGWEPEFLCGWIGPGSHPKARAAVLEGRRGQGRGVLTKGLELRTFGDKGDGQGGARI